MVVQEVLKMCGDALNKDNTMVSTWAGPRFRHTLVFSKFHRAGWPTTSSVAWTIKTHFRCFSKIENLPVCSWMLWPDGWKDSILPGWCCSTPSLFKIRQGFTFWNKVPSYLWTRWASRWQKGGRSLGSPTRPQSKHWLDRKTTCRHFSLQEASLLLTNTF